MSSSCFVTEGTNHIKNMLTKLRGTFPHSGMSNKYSNQLPFHSVVKNSNSDIHQAIPRGCCNHALNVVNRL